MPAASGGAASQPACAADGCGWAAVASAAADGCGFAYEGEPKADRPGLMRNMARVAELGAAMGVPVVPATGNNVGFARVKCGAGGREVDVRSLAPFMPRFLDRWLGMAAPPHRPSRCSAGREFVRQMMISEGDYDWLPPERFRAEGASRPCPKGAEPAELLRLQQWLHSADLLRFDDPGDGVVCKHVHVPGLGPEVDISPAGVNKGSAIATLLRDAAATLGVDAGTDGARVA
eukprot:gene34352-22194_t